MAELLGFPARDRAVDRSLGLWGTFLPGLCQVVTGIVLFVGLTWCQVFKDPALFMAAWRSRPMASTGSRWDGSVSRATTRDPTPVCRSRSP